MKPLPPSEQGLYPIRTVSEATGVNAITLRAWERRYGILKPKRSPKGHRMYSEQDIERVFNILKLLKQGIAVGHVKQALESVESQESFVPSVPDTQNGDIEVSQNQWTHYKGELLKAIQAFDLFKLEHLHHEAFSLYPLTMVSESLLKPTLYELKARANQLASISGEYHYYHSFLTQRIGSLYLSESLKHRGQRLLMISLDQQNVDIEMMLAGLPLLTHGYHTILLGSHCPLDSIPLSASSSKSEGVIFYADDLDNWSENSVVKSQIQTLAATLTIPVFIAGKLAAKYSDELAEMNITSLDQDIQQQLDTLDNIFKTDIHPLNK